MSKVVVEPEAKSNLRAHYLNLQRHATDPGYPARWFAGIRAAILDLAHTAEECGPAYEDRFFSETIRQRLFHSYKILFTIRHGTVHILHIRHQAQDPHDLMG